MGLVSFLLLWEVLSLVLNDAVLPTPVEVVPLFFRLIIGELGLHFLGSTARVVIAIAVALLTAVPAGLALGVIPTLNRMLSPLVDLIHPIPKIVFLPVIYVLVGVSNASKVLLIAAILFFQILVVVRDAALGMPGDLIRSARSIGAGRLALFLFIYLPGSLPAVLTAVRISVGTAVAVLFIAEQSLTRYGLGYYIIVRSYQVLRYANMYAGILAISLMGLLIYGVVNMLERRVTRHLHVPGSE